MTTVLDRERNSASEKTFKNKNRLMRSVNITWPKLEGGTFHQEPIVQKAFGNESIYSRYKNIP